MTRIAVLGANGQVGAEVAAYLAARPDVEVTGIVRSGYGATLLALLGIPHVVADVADTARMRAVLASCDAVADFTLPGGQLTEIPKALERNTRALLSAMQPGTRLLHMSSIMAWGMSGNSVTVEYKRFPRDSYAYVKRRGEQIVSRLARHHGVETWIIRLAQVHGVLQGVSQAFSAEVSDGTAISRGAPETLSNTVFAFSVADAVVRAARSESPPGTYTLVSSPQWPLSDLYGYYAEKMHVPLDVTYVPFASAPPVTRRLAGGVWKRLMPLRGILESYVLLRAPSLFPRVKGAHRRRSTAAAVADLRAVRGEPTHHITGPVPGPTLAPVRSDPADILAAENDLESRLRNAIERGRRS